MHKATILTIGDELLIGQTIDTNSAWMGQELNKLGIHIEEKIAVSDTKEGIISGIERAMSTSNIVLITGGLGPTKDDITKKVMADYFGMGMRFDEPTYERILSLFERWGRSTTEAHKLQCYMPDRVEILQNKMGTAPGMLFEEQGIIMVSMPGVPYEMKYIMQHHVLPLLHSRFQDQAIVHHTLMTAGEGESRIANKIDAIVDNFPPHISIAYLPNLGQVRLRLTAKGNDEAALKEELLAYGKIIKNELGSLIYGYNEEPIEERIGILAKEKGKTIGTAESCTGGLIAQKIVGIPGSSAYFQGSTVTYSNALKTNLLGVTQNTLDTYGAVSEETVTQMVKGGIELLGVDIIVAVSGIAGPSGGSEEKPVGTVWIACGTKDNIKTLKISAGKNREKNIEYASNYALNTMRLFLEAL